MLIRFVTLCVAVALCAASASPPTYRVRRSALVPHPAAPAWSGQPLRRPVELRARNSTVLVPVAPTEAPGANAGLYVARHNLGATLRARAGTNWALGLSYDVGLARDAMQIAPYVTKPPDDGSATTWRVSARYSLPLQRGLRLGFGGTLGLLQAPYHETGECIANCDYAAPYYEESGRKTVGVASTSVVVSWRRRSLTLFGGLTAQNHPRNTKNGTYTVGDDDSADELDPGPWYPMIGGGAEWEAGGGVKLLGQVYQPLSNEVVDYGPVVGVSVAIALGDPVPAR